MTHDEMIEPSWQDVAERLDAERLEHVATIADLRAKLATAEDENARLREALSLASRWLGDGDPNNAFEDIAEWFRSETGMLRPGKDEPFSSGAVPYEQRRIAFENWAKAKGDRVRATVRAALLPKPPSRSCVQCGAYTNGTPWCSTQCARR